MLTSFLLTSVLAQQSVTEQPLTRLALNQNQVTYFCDLAIVEVAAQEPIAEERTVEGSFGSGKRPFEVYSARIIDANFEDAGAIRLVMPCWFITPEPSRVGAVTIERGAPLQAGRYFVAGRLATNNKLPMTPDGLSLGTEDKSHKPSIRLVMVASGPSELGVFSMFKTEDRSIGGKDRTPSSVLSSTLGASLADQDSFLAVASMFLRTNHLAFDDWASAAKAPADFARSVSSERPAVQRALLLAIAFKCGSADVERAFLQAMVDADSESAGFWDSSVGSHLLSVSRTGALPRSDAYDASRQDPERQVLIAGLLAAANSNAIRGYLLSRTTSHFDARMAPDLRRALAKTSVDDSSCDLFLRRLAEWYSEPLHSPKPRTAPETKEQFRSRLEVELDFWRARLAR